MTRPWQMPLVPDTPPYPGARPDRPRSALEVSPLLLHPHRSGRGDLEVTLFQLREAMARSRAQAWIREHIVPLADLPEPKRIRILDFHAPPPP